MKTAPSSTGQSRGKGTTFSLLYGTNTPTPTLSFLPLARGEHDASGHAIPIGKVTALWPSQDSWGREEPVLCPYPGSPNPVRTEGGRSRKVGVLGYLQRTLGSRPSL